MFNAPFFAANYFPDPYFPKPIAFTPPTNGNGAFFPAWYFGMPNAPGNFWVIGAGAVPPTPPAVDNGGGGGTKKKNRALGEYESHLHQLHEEDELVLDVIKLFLRDIQ